MYEGTGIVALVNARVVGIGEDRCVAIGADGGIVAVRPVVSLFSGLQNLAYISHRSPIGAYSGELQGTILPCVTPIPFTLGSTKILSLHTVILTASGNKPYKVSPFAW